MQKAPAGSFSSLVCFCSLFKACGDLNWGEIVSETNHQSFAASALTHGEIRRNPPNLQKLGYPSKLLTFDHSPAKMFIKSVPG